MDKPNTEITIIDCGMGNLGSIKNMLKHLGIPSIMTSEPSEIETAKKLILPGVGAFDNGMRNLSDSGMLDILNDEVLEKKTPVLGICLGMQLFANRSEEGNLPGLGWINAEIAKFKFQGENGKLKVPHMGWNAVELKKTSRLFSDMYDQPRFYFVHSYHLVCDNDEDVLCTTHHGCEFTSAIEKENIFGVQFHPEKSHKYGIRLLKNFAELT